MVSPIIKKATTMKNFIQHYVKNLTELLNNIDINAIEQIKELLDSTIEKKSKIYIIGNGGSSSTASHMSNDLGVGLKLRNIRNFNVESLGDNSAVCSAIANDTGYENIFYTQLTNKITKDDVLIAISCSGTSPNILKATKYAKEVGTTIVGVTGFNGGELKELSDINFHIQTVKGEYGLVEDMHMILDHIIFSYYLSLKN